MELYLHRKRWHLHGQQRQLRLLSSNPQRPAFTRRARALRGARQALALPLAGLTLVASAQAQSRPCAWPEAALDKAASAPLEPAPDSVALPGPGLALVLDAGPVAAALCAPANIARAVLTRSVLDAQRALGVDATLAIVSTSAPLGCNNLYYIPLANDVRGIGYAHHDAREVFDDTPEQRLEGIAFLNDWPYWQSHPDELPSALRHEVGHRWGARVHVRLAGESSSVLLGRDQEHWSYYFSTGGSPLEGNVWVPSVAGYASQTPLYPGQFSALDLYLMGVASAAEVPAAALLAPGQAAAVDCVGLPLRAGSPPQTCGSLSLEATSRLVGIDDIIAAEGPRSPAPGTGPRSIDVLPLVLQSSDAAWATADCEAAALSLREAIDGFESATGGRLRLRDVLAEGASCDELSRASAPPAPAAGTPSSACSLAARPPVRARGLLVLFALALAGALRARRRRASASASTC